MPIYNMATEASIWLRRHGTWALNWVLTWAEKLFNSRFKDIAVIDMAVIATPTITGVNITCHKSNVSFMTAHDCMMHAYVMAQGPWT